MKWDGLFIYPKLGAWDDTIRDIPLSILYASAASSKYGFRIKLLDLRLTPKDWIEQVRAVLAEGVRVVGVSVMTGEPIRHALEVSGLVRKYSKDTKILWGGPHPTVLPEQTLSHPDIDFIIRDWGSESTCLLLRHLAGENIRREDIRGLGWKENGTIRWGPVHDAFEIPDYKSIPYDLIDINPDKYNRLKNNDFIFSLFTAMGCPYRCAYCISPATYKKVKGKRWIALPPEEVLDHIAWIAEKYPGVNRLQVLDDDSFVDLDRIRRLLHNYVKSGYHSRFKLDFRGVRINELDRMTDADLALLDEASVEMMLIGVESGSDRVLSELMCKDITVDQIIRVNRRLAEHPKLQPHYNFFCGTPGETLADLRMTARLLLQLAEDNPFCYLGFGADWKPLPGSAMTERAVRDYGLQLPETLSDWSKIDSYQKLRHPWYTTDFENGIKVLQLAGALLDRKVESHSNELGFVVGSLIRLGAGLYRPILRWRVRNGIFLFPIEHMIRNWFLFSVIPRIMRGKSQQ
jgi:anaerobic magnesium-protoporphyrin IX monomethyl ester cyclase